MHGAPLSILYAATANWPKLNPPSLGGRRAVGGTDKIFAFFNRIFHFDLEQRVHEHSAAKDD